MTKNTEPLLSYNKGTRPAERRDSSVFGYGRRTKLESHMYQRKNAIEKVSKLTAKRFPNSSCSFMFVICKSNLVNKFTGLTALPVLDLCRLSKLEKLN